MNIITMSAAPTSTITTTKVMSTLMSITITSTP